MGILGAVSVGVPLAVKGARPGLPAKGKAAKRVEDLAEKTSLADNGLASRDTARTLTKDEAINLNAQRDDGELFTAYKTSDGKDWDWNSIAPNNGAALGSTKSVTLNPGDVVDRYGRTRGTFLSPVGTPYEQRSLAPGTRAEPYSQYVVVKPFTVERSEIAPAFGQEGGGTQYRIPEVSGRKVTVKDLLDNGYLRKK
jgi:filamentous hemagglutinin